MLNDRIGIELELIGYDGIFSDIKVLEETLNNLSHMRYRIRFDTEINRIKTQIRELETKKLHLIEDDDREGLADINTKLKEARQALKNLQQMGKNAIFEDKTYKKYFADIEQKIVNTGERLQTLGRTITGVTSMFTRPFTGALFSIGSRAISTISEGISGAFERYDTMRTYARSLTALGYGAEESQKAVEELRDSVIGLPTGLDEIVRAQKTYVGAMGDVEKATQLAIAANNTFLASDMGSREQRYMQKYLMALGSGADLAASQWQSMARIAPLAMRAVGEELGYGEDRYDEFTEAVKRGTISGQEFLNTFIKVGTSGKIAQAVNVLKQTFTGLVSNIGIAFARLGADVLNTLDDVFKAYNGRDLLQNLLGYDAQGNDTKDGIKDWVDSISKSIQGWIKANPEKITGFFERLKQIDIVGYLKGMASAFGSIVETLSKIPTDNLEWLGKLMMYGRFIGPLITAWGGLVKGFAGPLAKAGLGMEGVGTAKGGGIFSFLRNLVKAKSSAKGATEAAESVAEAGKAASAIPISWQGVVSKAVTIAAIPAIAGSILLVAKAMKEIDDVDINWSRFGRNMAQMALAFSGFAAAAAGLGALIMAPGIGFITAGSMAAGLAAVAGISAAVHTMADSLKAVSEVNIPSKGKIEKLVTSLSSVFTAFAKMDTEGLSPRDAKNQKKIAKSISETIGSLPEIYKGLEEIAKMKDIDKKVEAAIPVIENLSKALKPLKEAMAKMFGAYEENYGEGGPLVTRRRFDSSAAAEYTEMIKSVDESLTGITTMLDSVKTLSDKAKAVFDKNGKSYIDFTALKQNLNKIIKNINELTIGGEESGTGLTMTGEGNNLHTLSMNGNWTDPEAIEKLKSSLTNLSSVIDALKIVNDKVAVFQESGGVSKAFEDFMGEVQNVSSLLTTSLPLNANYTTSWESFGKSLDVLKTIPAKLQSIVKVADGLEGTVDRVKDFINQMNFGDRKIKASIKIKFEVKFENTVMDIMQKIREFRDTVAGQLANMPATYSKAIKVNYTVSSNNPTIPAPHIPGTNQQSMKVNEEYLASGGSIFHRHGTDTVPAMLTPGEFVMKRRAVNTFGADFMARVNALDIDGAIRALHARVGESMTSSRKVVINNYQNDNRQYNNTQNITTNNPNFAFRRSRWVSELR